MASAVDIISWNVRGMGDATKRYALFRTLKEFPNAIVPLQKTHMTPERLHLLNKPWVGASFHSTFNTHSRGISVLIPSIIPFHCEQSLIDMEGRYVCLRCRIFNISCILATIDIPPYMVDTLNKVLLFIMAHPALPLLLMGDFNMYLNQRLDKYSASASEGIPDSTARLGFWGNYIFLIFGDCAFRRNSNILASRRHMPPYSIFILQLATIPLYLGYEELSIWLGGYRIIPRCCSPWSCNPLFRLSVPYGSSTCSEQQIWHLWYP